jgi:tRNA modification GTPase
MFDYNSSDPIVALSTPNTSNAAIGIIRLSGFDLSILENFLSTPINKITTKQMHRSFFIDPNKNVLDDVCFTLFKAPASYTGENVLEIYAHGNQLLLNKLLDVLVINHGFRFAGPGEFTLRALRAGKINLSQVEGLDLLLNAKNDFALSSGFSILSGEFNQLYSDLYTAYINHRSAAEIGFDFLDDIGEEQFNHLFSNTWKDLEQKINTLYQRSQVDLNFLLNPTIALFGHPNAGKSSLFNILLGKERSIVHSSAGTTRDYISEHINIDNSLYQIIDTAGLHHTEDEVELAGIKKVQKIVVDSFFKILVHDIADEVFDFDYDFSLIVLTHTDLYSNEYIESRLNFFKQKSPAIVLANLTAIDGSIGPIRNAIFKSISQSMHELSKPNSMPIERHRNVISGIYKQSRSYGGILVSENDMSILFIELQTLGRHIEELIGVVTSDDVLSYIFKNFCIGK